MWDLTAPGQPAHILPTDSTNDLGSLSALAFLGGGSTLLTHASESGYLIWALDDLRPGGMPVSTPPGGHAGRILDVGVSADGRWLISGGAARVWDVQDGTPRLKASTVLRGHEGEVSSVALGRDGQWAAALASGEGFARFSPDGRWLATGAWQASTIELRDLTRPESLTQPLVLRRLKSGTQAMSFSPDSRWLVADANNGPQRLWDLTAADPRRASLVLEDLDYPTAPFFTSDGHWLVQYDGIRLLQWSLDVQQLAQEACEVVGRNLSQLE